MFSLLNPKKDTVHLLKSSFSLLLFYYFVKLLSSHRFLIDQQLKRQEIFKNLEGRGAIFQE